MSLWSRVRHAVNQAGHVLKFWSPSYWAFRFHVWLYREAWALTVPPPDLPGLPQERGDQRSTTYGWDGMQTATGQGLTIPVVFGEHDVAGQVIHTDVSATSVSGQTVDLLRLVLVLSEGPIYGIGDQLMRVADGLGGLTGGTPGGAIPSGIRVNGNELDSLAALPGARVWLRPGTFDQPALPSNPFPGAAATFSVGQQLQDAGNSALFTITSTDPISTVGWVFAAPGGLFQQDSNGNQTAYPVSISLAWRPSGHGAWRSFYDGTGAPFTARTFGSTPQLAAFLDTFGASLQPDGSAVVGPIEVQVTRSTAAGAQASVVSALLWRSVTIGVRQEFAYPGSALVALELAAGERFAGGIPNVQMRVRGVLVRTWDETHGFSAPCWDPPAAPHDYSTRPPGRNPAWILGEFVTNKRWGLGQFGLTDDDVDWPQLRRWAAFCQANPSPTWDEAAFCCDLVLDASRSAWDWVLAICSAGRAAPVWDGRKLSVVYRYRDEHGDSGVTVPAKTSAQLITSGNCEDVAVQWVSTAKRPTAFQFQFLNAAKAYAQDVLVEEDTEAPALQDPTDPNANAWRPEAAQVWGVVRESQLYREAKFRHRTNRLVLRQLTFTIGPWGLPLIPGDLIDFQHDLLRPFGDDDAPVVCQVVAVPATGQITVDHAITGTGLALSGRLPDGRPFYEVIGTATATTHRGRPATTLIYPGSSLLAVGATVVVGLADKLVEQYEVHSINLRDEVKRQVVALQWAPAVYDLVEPPTGGALSGVLRQSASGLEAPELSDLSVVCTGRGHRIAWQRPPGRGTARARVWVRQPDLATTWALIGETARADLDVDWLVAWRTYEVAVVLENAGGAFGAPDTGLRLEFVADEFPAWAPLAPTNLRALQLPLENLLVLRWDAAEIRELAYYEVRAGGDWAAGLVVYRGLLPEARLQAPPACGIYQVAARSRSGLYGPRAAVTVALEAIPYSGAMLEDQTDAIAGGGTHSDTEADSVTIAGETFVALIAGALAGTWTTDEVDLGSEAVRYLRVAWWPHELDGTTVDDWTFAAASGEARWRTLDARPASTGAPGLDWSTTVDDLVGVLAADLPGDLRAAGTLGEAGSHVQAVVESRVYAGGAWGDWQPHVDRLVTVEKWQARVALRRRSTERSIRVRTFTMETLA